MRARKGLRITAADLALVCGVVAFGRADRIGALLGRGAKCTRPDPAPALVFGLLGPHTGEIAERTHLALRHEIAGGDVLGHRAPADILGHFAEIVVLAPE